MNETTLAAIKEKANKGTQLQNRIEALRKLRDVIYDSELSVSVSYKNAAGFNENSYISKNTNDELLEPVKESLIDIVDNQIKMYVIEFEEL